MFVPSYLLALLALTGFARGTPAAGSCEWKKNYRSQNLIQIPVPQSNLALEETLVTELFSTHSVEEMGGVANSAITAVFDSDPTLKTFFSRQQYKMMNPVHYLAADGSLRVLARVTTSHYCGCIDPKKLCFQNIPLHGKNQDTLVSCSADGTGGCIVVGGFADPHAFQVQGHPWAFVIWGTFGACRPVLLNLETFSYSKLKLPGMSGCEKNWQGFDHEGDMLFSRWLVPDHKVIRCSASNASCEEVSSSSNSFSFDGLPKYMKEQKRHVHGSSPYVELDSKYLIAAAHIWGEDESGVHQYFHTLYAIQREPPFAVVANTRWFQFSAPAGYEDAEWTSIQFAGGLMRSGDDLRISYAVGDCISQALHLKVSEVAKALGLNDLAS